MPGTMNIAARRDRRAELRKALAAVDLIQPPGHGAREERIGLAAIARLKAICHRYCRGRDLKASDSPAEP